MKQNKWKMEKKKTKKKIYESLNDRAQKNKCPLNTIVTYYLNSQIAQRSYEVF